MDADRRLKVFGVFSVADFIRHLLNYESRKPRYDIVAVVEYDGKRYFVDVAIHSAGLDDPFMCGSSMWVVAGRVSKKSLKEHPWILKALDNRKDRTFEMLYDVHTQTGTIGPRNLR